jgi:branched-chain amino acid transport system substrate-binding protein
MFLEGSMTLKGFISGAAFALLSYAPAMAQAPVKIGMVTTLSGPGGYLGADVRDAFNLAIEMEGGKLGGVPVQVLIEDDALKPGQGKEIAERFMKTERVKLLTGIIFSNVAGAVVPDVLDNGGIYVSPNAGPSNFAGKECHANYFVVSWQNDTLHESAGQNATNLGFKRAVVLAPNYQAGRDAIAGFKRFFKGEVVGEIYTRLDQTDFAPEMAQVRAAKPDVVFQFHPGGLGITFARQYQQAGLLETIPMVVAAPSLDSVILRAVGDAAQGVHISSHWNSDLPNAANKEFVAAFQKKYNRMPTYYASQGYDTARAIGAALKATGGKVDDTKAFSAAMRKADFQSVRGNFKFGPNNHPINDWYSLRVERASDGNLAIVTKGRILENHSDFYAKDCKI